MHKILTVSMSALMLATPAVAQEAMGTFTNIDGAEAGTVSLTQGEGTVTLSGEVMGLTVGEHGIHFHQTGDCDPSTKFESAGSHFNPEDHQHGLENPEGPHAGDLPNISVSTEGSTRFELTSDLVSLVEGEPGYVYDADGTALVIHAAVDDQVTDPSGNSGDRLVCAVIEPARDQ